MVDFHGGSKEGGMSSLSSFFSLFSCAPQEKDNSCNYVVIKKGKRKERKNDKKNDKIK
jgi:hypothetical protein